MSDRPKSLVTYRALLLVALFCLPGVVPTGIAYIFYGSSGAALVAAALYHLMIVGFVLYIWIERINARG